jgi:hypothetical protein
MKKVLVENEILDYGVHNEKRMINIDKLWRNSSTIF